MFDGIVILREGYDVGTKKLGEDGCLFSLILEFSALAVFVNFYGASGCYKLPV